MAATILALVAGLLVAACGGGSDGGSASTSIVASLDPGEEEAGGLLPPFRESQLVSGRAGWARSAGGGYWWTGGGGRHWRRITPPAQTGVESIYFEDRRRGWAFAEEGREGSERRTFFSTVDGGRTWRRSPTPIESLGLPAASASFSPVGDGLVFALVRQSGDTASNFGVLMRSDDGGGDWRETAELPPKAGQIEFESARDGWLAAGYPGPGLWRTHDGGRDWEEVRPPPPREAGKEYSANFLPPRIGLGGHGLLAGVFVARFPAEGLGSGAATAVLYSTSDGGRHWRLAAGVPQNGGGSLEARNVLAFRGSRTVVVHSSSARLLRTLTASGKGPTRRADGLPDSPLLTFSGQRFGFADPRSGRDRSLSFTADGGRHWHRVAPIRAGRPGGTVARR